MRQDGPSTLVLLCWLSLCSHCLAGTVIGKKVAPRAASKQLVKRRDDKLPILVPKPGEEVKTGPGSSTYIAMCLIVRDQWEDLPEWLEHYLKLGVRRFYVWDHGSRPPLIPVFANLAYAGIVEYHWITAAMVEKLTGFKHTPPKPGQRYRGVNSQLFVYEQCMKRYRNRHQWIAFFDSDEFLMLRDRSVKDLPTFLKPFEPYGGLVVQWTLFGSSGHITKPAGSTLESYWKCQNNSGFKTIVNTRYGDVPNGNPHAFRYKDGAFAVNERFERQDGPGSPIRMADRVVLYHYVIKSLEEFEAKSARGSGAGNHKQAIYMEAVDKHATDDCTDAVELMKGRVWKGQIRLS